MNVVCDICNQKSYSIPSIRQKGEKHHTDNMQTHAVFYFYAIYFAQIILNIIQSEQYMVITFSLKRHRYNYISLECVYSQRPLPLCFVFDASWVWGRKPQPFLGGVKLFWNAKIFIALFNLNILLWLALQLPYNLNY